MTGSRQYPPVMVLGCGRSGTSIFGELFDGLGPYVYESEPPFQDVLDRSETDCWAVKVPRESPGHPVDDGLSFSLDILLATHPAIQLFWIVRHPLDAISSLRIGVDQNWGHHPRPPDWQHWLDRPLVERCAHHWAHINSHGYGRVKSVAKLVYFEDMIRDPYGFALNICSILGLPPEENEAYLRKWAARVQDTNNKQFVEAVTSQGLSRLDHSVRIGRWRENLSSNDIQAAEKITSRIARAFNYDTDWLAD
ncbi:sulfotransferase [Sneathiella marina]|uniref:Sulfotransferase n=1 Tax=Sneathiella marina TaxID=2950108 RepID=A0ABY4W1V3_9PROT|nr:sulfotransferase [Sneathiella marina]USG60083.1 sulfotransferase [Sneathiella marina]